MKNHSILNLACLVENQKDFRKISVQDWSEIIRLAIRHGLAPLLWWRLTEQGAQVSDNAGFQALANTAKIAAFNYLLIQENRSRVQNTLTRAGIQTIWLKGVALAETLYPQPQLRPMDDLDVLVPYDQRHSALEVLQSVGYRLAPKMGQKNEFRLPESMGYHYHFLEGPSSKIELEIHYRLLRDESLLGIDDMDWFWQEKEEIGQDQATYNILKPEAHLLYLAAHTILQHGEFEFRLQRFYDLHLLAGQSRLNWDLVLNKAVELGWTYTIARALFLTRYFFSTPIPQSFLDDIGKFQASDKDYRHARRLQGPGLRWEWRLLYLSEYSWIERIRQVFHMVFPSMTFMRARYAIPAGRAVLPYYVIRWADASRVVLASIIRRFRYGL